MLASSLLAASMAVAGHSGAPIWIVLLGAFGILTEGWWLKLRQLRHAPWSTKTTGYFITGIGANIGLAGVGYFAGRLIRIYLG